MIAIQGHCKRVGISRGTASCPGQFVILLSVITGGLTVSENRMTGEDIPPIPAGQSTSFRHESLVSPAR